MREELIETNPIATVKKPKLPFKLLLDLYKSPLSKIMIRHDNRSKDFNSLNGVQTN